jgi:prepilin-type N-terminal cleavage/methylation domain-containing protein
MRRGLTFLEVLIAVGLIAIVSGLAMISSRDKLPFEKLVSETRLVSQRLGQMSIDARASGKTIKISCSSSGLQADIYNVKSNDYQTASTATSSASKTNLLPIDIESLTNDIFISALWTNSNSNCATPKTFYITSRGHFFSSQGVGGVELEFNLSTNMYGTKLVISGENAIARLYIREKLNAYSDL